MTFLKDVGRYNQKEKKDLEEQIREVKMEAEQKVGVRMELEKIINGWEYWNDQGKVTRMAIIKPANQDG